MTASTSTSTSTQQQHPSSKCKHSTPPPSSPEWFTQGQTPEVLTADFIIRSLRRRLWKACQEDNAETAIRAYQATRLELEQWLQEEEDQRAQLVELERMQQEQEAAKHEKKTRPSLFGRKSLTKRKMGSESSSLRLSMTSATSTSAGQWKPSACLEAAGASYNHASATPYSNSEDHFHLIDLHNLKGPILESLMNPSEPFIADDMLSPYDLTSYDHPARHNLPDLDKYNHDELIKYQKQELRHHQRRQRLRSPRIAGMGIFRKSQDDSMLSQEDRRMARLEQELATSHENGRDAADAADAAAAASGTSQPMMDDVHMTTPLHEAARLGSGDMIRFFLTSGGDPNVRNGMARTALHMASGGVTVEEARLTVAMKRAAVKTKTKRTKAIDKADIGIRAPDIQLRMFDLMRDEQTKKTLPPKGTARKAAKVVARMMRSALGNGKDKPAEESIASSSYTKGKKTKNDPARLNHLLAECMDAVLAVLSWNHAETGDGPSINAVDTDGRTALHYAAELGRADVCMAILSNFGAMLTIIDELGARTPCELAGAQGHGKLAAQLEARAVLYIDPYGVDDELLANMLHMNGGVDNIDPRRYLVAPYSWFETMTIEAVGAERSKRIQTARSKLLKVISSWDTTNTMSSSEMDKLMASAAKVGLSGALHDDDDDSCGNAARKVTADSGNDGTPNLVKSPRALFVASSDEVVLETATGLKEESGDAFFEDGVTKQESDAAAPRSTKAEPHDGMMRTFSNLHESHIERFLMHHKWNVNYAVKMFKKDPEDAFTKAGVPLPVAVSGEPSGETKNHTCLICYDDEVGEDDWVHSAGCAHGFCSDCLKDYVNDCASSKMAVSSIACPHHECETIMAPKDLKSLLSDESDMADRIQEATLEQFVSSSHDFRFCNHPGCSGIVHRVSQPFLAKNGIDIDIVNYTGAVCTATPADAACEPIGDGCMLTYEGVEDLKYNNCRSLEQPRKAHRFCFSCGEGKHWPVSCESLEEWRRKMREELGEIESERVDEADGDFTDLAQKLWLRANTRPCPKCEVPIEKNDGCNHMTCSNPSCRYEFCWICRKDWKLHGTSTGGFFRCNIWQEDGQEPSEGVERTRSTPEPAVNHDFTDPSEDEGYGTAIHSAREAYRKRQEMARFVHHYTRWEAHGESATLEKNMGNSVCSRLAPVVAAAMEFDGSSTFNFSGKGLSFVHAAFTELLECRSILKHSFAFSYFRYPTFYQFRRYGQLNSRRREKTAFERLQSELEMMTEQMSDIVARSHLRATQVQIAFLTAGAAEKREEFTNLMFSILNEERKEVKAEEKAKRASATVQSSRHRSTDPLGQALRRAVEGAYPSDEGLGGDVIRDGIDEHLSRGVPLDVHEPPEPAVNMWECVACTYMNSSGHQCAMCGSSR